MLTHIMLTYIRLTGIRLTRIRRLTGEIRLIRSGCLNFLIPGTDRQKRLEERDNELKALKNDQNIVLQGTYVTYNV